MNQTKQAWRRPKTAPKDGKQFIADFGYPWPLSACWNERDEQAQLTLIQLKHGAAATRLYKAKRALGWTVQKALEYALDAFKTNED